jgi:hypothetical protein
VNNTTNTSIVLANIDAAVAEATATNHNKHIPHAQAFVAKVLNIEPIGKKQAELQGCKTTAEATLDYLRCGGGTCITAPLMAKVRSLASYFEDMAPRNEFEQNVVKHTLESLRIGSVEPRSAAFVAWAGKVYRDRIEAEAALAEAVPPGSRMWCKVTCDGIRQVNTSFGVKAVHSFTTDGGKKLEWWTDLKVSDFDEDGNLVPAFAAGIWIDFNCRIKGSSVWQGKLTYKITHAKWDERVAADLAPKAPAAAPAAPAAAAPVALAPKAPEATTALPF